MSENCQADELRTLFLFEHLSDAQLDLLCTAGRVETIPAGPLFREGEPATYFYVLIDGELIMSGRQGASEVQTNRTSQRGVYFGAWSAYNPNAVQVHEASITLLKPSRLYVLAADAFADFMRSQFPMAVHLLAGHIHGTLRQQQLLGQRARLLGLGTITAGLTHHLNNPAAAITRAGADLQNGVGRSRGTLKLVAEARLSPETVLALIDANDDASRRIVHARQQPLGSLDSSDLEERITDWLDDRGVNESWRYATTFAEAQLDEAWLQDLSDSVSALDDADRVPDLLQQCLTWLKDAVDTDLRTREIVDAGRRISALLAGAEQYSQMDRGEYQQVDVHELLQSTLLMFGSRIGPGSEVTVIREWDPDVPQIGCYAGDLNQVWTNVIQNAIEAMNGRGTLTLRTASTDDTVSVEIGDTGPGIAEADIDHVFTAFFTTKPERDGSGLGLDLAWRIVEKHGGTLSVQSRPGDTRFTVCLPVHAPTHTTTELPESG